MTTSVHTPTLVNPSAQAATTRPATISIAPGRAGSTVPTRPMTTSAMPITHKTIVIALTPSSRFPTSNHSQPPPPTRPTGRTKIGSWWLGVGSGWELVVGHWELTPYNPQGVAHALYLTALCRSSHSARPSRACRALRGDAGRRLRVRQAWRPRRVAPDGDRSGDHPHSRRRLSDLDQRDCRPRGGSGSGYVHLARHVLGGVSGCRCRGHGGRTCPRQQPRHAGAGTGQATRPSRGAQSRDGVLLLQQHRDRGGIGARAWSEPRGHRGLRRPSWQRHAVELLQRPVGAVYLLTPVSVLSGDGCVGGHRNGSRRRLHHQPSTERRRDRRGL